MALAHTEEKQREKSCDVSPASWALTEHSSKATEASAQPESAVAAPNTTAESTQSTTGAVRARAVATLHVVVDAVVDHLVAYQFCLLAIGALDIWRATDVNQFFRRGNPRCDQPIDDHQTFHFKLEPIGDVDEKQLFERGSEMRSKVSGDSVTGTETKTLDKMEPGEATESTLE